MSSLKSTSYARCRYAACFALGFVVASIVLAVMFWIIWCYMGLSIVQISDTQRRAIVNYSYTTSKPSTSIPANRTDVEGATESSLNAISKSLVTPPSQLRRKSDSSTDLAKGDFAARPQGGATHNATRGESVMSSSHERKASIVHEGAEDNLHPRKVSTSNTANHAPEVKLPEIKPTQTYATAQSDPLLPQEERRPISRDSDKKDEVKSSRPSYRDPEFEREPLPRRSEPGRRRYDDEDDYYDRGSPSRYDKRDRGRDTDDRYSKGDTRVYPDERPVLDDRYPTRDSDRRRGDDRDFEDRYRDRKERPRDYDDKYRDRADRPRDYDDRYKDREDRSREYDDRYRDKVDRPREYDDRFKDKVDRPSDYDDRYRDRDGPYKDDERNRRRDDRYDDRYVSRDDRYISKYPDDDDRSRERPYTDKRDRVVSRDDEDRYTRDRDYREPITSSRTDISSDRKSGRPEYFDSPIRDRPRTHYNDESRIIDRYPSRDDEYLRPSNDTISPTRIREEAYTSRSTVPLTRSRDDPYYSGSSIIDGRKRDDDRYSSDRDRSKYYKDDDRRVDESRSISPSSVRKTSSSRRDVYRDDYPTRSLDDKKLDDVGLERRSYSAEEEEEYRRQNSRTRYYDDPDRKSFGDSRRDYRTDDDFPRRRVDDDEYRRSRPRGDYDPDRSRDSDLDDDTRPSRRYLPEYDEPRRRSDADIGLRKESYPRGAIEEDRKLPRRPEKDRRYDEDIPPRRFYDDDIDDRPLRPAVDDRPLRSSVDDRPLRSAVDDRPLRPVVDDRPLRPVVDDRPLRTAVDDRPLRPAVDDRSLRSDVDDRPLRPAIDRVPDDGRRRYKDDVSSRQDESSRHVPLRSEKREPFVGSSSSPIDAVVREKRYPFDDPKIDERPINTKDVIEAALKHPDAPIKNPREVYYPVFDPRFSNLTSTDNIPLSDRRGSTISSRRRRSWRTY